MLVPGLFFAGCGATKLTITFDTNGGSFIERVLVKSGESISKPTDPIKEDYIFDGWFWDEDFQLAFRFGEDKITKDTILYAKWRQPKTFEITFNSNGGSKVPNQYMQEGGSFAKPEMPTRVGYVFDDWYLNNGQKFDFDVDFKNIIEDTTLFARWNALFTLSQEGTAITGLTDYSRNIKNLVIPDEIDGNVITTLKEGALAGGKFETLEFGKDLKTFESKQFIGKALSENPLKEVYFNGTIDDWVKILFADTSPLCANFDGVKLFADDEEVSGNIAITANVNYIQPYAFAGLKITGVTLPESVKFIGNSAFYNCSKLTTINLEKVVYIYEGAFWGCAELQSVSLDLAQKIFKKAFFECLKLKDVKVGSYLNEVQQEAFLACPIEKIDLAITRLEKLGEKAFGCTALREVKLPYTLTEYHLDSFFNCMSLKTMIIDSNTIYQNLSQKPSFCGGLTTFKVSDSVIQNSGENTWLYNTEIFTHTQENGYHVFTFNYAVK